MDRNRYADLLRVAAMGGVVSGHWLLISITYAHGQLSGLNALDYVSWARWATWLFQAMPVFFLVGGYVNARSWTAHHASGEDWVRWVRGRALRLLWPAAVFGAVAVLAVGSARLAGVSSGEVSEAGWLVALHLWFLPVYLLLITLTPVLLPAHRRWGLAVPAAMAVAAALVDAGVRGPHVHVIGYASYLFVWGSVHQWGFAWQDGTLTRARWRPYALAATGAGLLACVLAWRVFNVDMIGAGNTNPPSVALLGYAAAQAGLLLAAEPALSPLLLRPGLWQRVSSLNAAAMTVYLWHFVPAIVIAVACYPTGVLPQPTIGTAPWWGLRPAWLALLTAALVPLVIAFRPAERPPAWLSCGRRPSGPWPPAILLAGLAAAMTGLARLAIAGFAPGGHLPVLNLAALAVGLTAIVLAAGDSHRGPAPSSRIAHPHPDRLPRKITSRRGPAANPPSSTSSGRGIRPRAHAASVVLDSRIVRAWPVSVDPLIRFLASSAVQVPASDRGACVLMSGDLGPGRQQDLRSRARELRHYWQARRPVMLAVCRCSDITGPRAAPAGSRRPVS